LSSVVLAAVVAGILAYTRAYLSPGLPAAAILAPLVLAFFP
jgi:hypothetical protein